MKVAEMSEGKKRVARGNNSCFLPERKSKPLDELVQTAKHFDMAH